MFTTKRLLPGADKEQNEKFLRLMGGKKAVAKLEEVQKDTEVLESESERQERIALDLQKEYDRSRMQTHLVRGSGLGYSGTMYQPMG